MRCARRVLVLREEVSELVRREARPAAAAAAAAARRGVDHHAAQALLADLQEIVSA